MHVLWFLSAASKPSVWRVVFLSHFPCCSYWEKIWEWPSQSSPDHSPTLPKITHLKSITNSKSPSPSLLSRHSPVCTLSHQNWADYLSLSLQKAWMLKTHYMVFCGRGRSLKCSEGGSTSPPKRFEKFSITPRVSCSHHTYRSEASISQLCISF